MDPVSHAVIGSAVAALVPASMVHPAITWGIIIGAEIPDIDFLVRYWGGDVTYLRTHRGPTHGFLVTLGHALLITTLLWFIWPVVSFWTLYQWTLLGCLSHVLFDLGNDYGTQGLWPFSKRRIAFDVIPIIDVVLFGIIGVGWMATAFWPGHRQSIFFGAWAIMAFYVAARLWLRAAAYRLVTAKFEPQGPCGEVVPCGPDWTEQRVTIHPTLFSLNAWRYVIQAPGEYLIGMVWVSKGKVSKPERARNELDKIVKASLTSQIVTAFAGWARRPRVQVDRLDGMYRVRWADMRYDMGDFSPFMADAWLDEDLNLVDDRLGAQRPIKIDRQTLKRRLLSEMGRQEP
jgi:inner membrane protein